jgi:hypothetical protein
MTSNLHFLLNWWSSTAFRGDVQSRIRGDGPLNRAELVKYALDHWNDSSLDWAGKDNCTNFASTVLAHAGMPETESWSKDPWQRLGHSTHSWGGSGELHDYLIADTQSREVPLSEARPGDLIFLRQLAPSDDPATGDIHHTAIVTSVTPDGVIHYTQHSDSNINVSLQGREDGVVRAQGEQEQIIMRLDPAANPEIPTQGGF